MVAVALALGSSLAWGASDFVAGVKTRRLAVLSVLLVSQATGTSIVLAVVAIGAEPPPATGPALLAMLSGLADALCLVCLYRAMSVGKLSVVTPLAAGAGLLPVVVGAASGAGLTSLQLAGGALAVGGAVLAGRETAPESVARGAIVAGAGFALAASVMDGASIVAIDAAAEGGVAWAVLIDRITALAILTGAALVIRHRLEVERGDLGPLIAVGVLDIVANLFFTVALTHGHLGAVAVLGTLYPVTTVLLAITLLRERVGGLQGTGVVACIAGVALLAGAG